MKDTGIPQISIDKFRSLFKKYPLVKEAILFGSRAKGNFREGSDCDIALKGKHIDFSLLAQMEADYEDLYLPWKLDLRVYENIHNQDLRDRIDRVGVILYQKK